MEYNFSEIEKRWQKAWAENKTYKVTEDKSKQKFYVLNMFPYPSGAGLHVGHPLGYIASDIYARFKRLQGFNVLNPMPMDFPLNNMPFRLVNTQQSRPKPISITTANNWIRLVFRLIGIAKFALVTRNTTIGHNGLS